MIPYKCIIHQPFSVTRKDLDLTWGHTATIREYF